MKRLENETMGQYKIRRDNEKESINNHLKGTVIVEGKQLNRQAQRNFVHRSKHFTKGDKFFYLHVRLKRLRKLFCSNW